MFRTILVLTMIVCIGAGSSGSDVTQQKKKQRTISPPTRNPHYKRKEFSTKNGLKVVYYLMAPKDYDAKHKYPLVLALHGRGGNTTAANVLGRDKMRNQYRCFVMAPMAPRPYRWASPKNLPNGSKKRLNKLPAVFQAMKALQKEVSIDANRIYVTGQSMGGFGSLGAVAARPDLFAAAVPICGGWTVGDAKKMAKVPFWIFHGADDNVVPVSYSRKIVKALKKAGGTPKYTEYAGVKHNSWTKAYETAELWKWIFSQRRRTLEP